MTHPLLRIALFFKRPFGDHVTMLHPWQRDTGKYAAQGPNIMSPEAPLMPPEARRAELEGRGRHQGGRGRHNVARGRHIFPVAQGQGCDIDIII